MSVNAKRARSLVITVIAIAATNYAISFASGVAQPPEAPRPKTNLVAAKSGVAQPPEAPRPKSGVAHPPEAPRP